MGAQGRRQAREAVGGEGAQRALCGRAAPCRGHKVPKVSPAPCLPREQGSERPFTSVTCMNAGDLRWKEVNGPGDPSGPFLVQPSVSGGCRPRALLMPHLHTETDFWPWGISGRCGAEGQVALVVQALRKPTESTGWVQSPVKHRNSPRNHSRA